jgi:hypothetical protein
MDLCSSHHIARERRAIKGFHERFTEARSVSLALNSTGSNNPSATGDIEERWRAILISSTPEVHAAKVQPFKAGRESHTYSCLAPAPLKPIRDRRPQASRLAPVSQQKKQGVCVAFTTSRSVRREVLGDGPAWSLGICVLTASRGLTSCCGAVPSSLDSTRDPQK